MAKKAAGASKQPAKGAEIGEVQDFSKRYPGAEQVEGAGSWFQFEDVGEELVGKYLGTEPFRNGHKSTIETSGGTFVFSTPTLLRQQLLKIKIGENVAIVLAGFQASDKASPLKVFQVFRPKARA